MRMDRCVCVCVYFPWNCPNKRPIQFFETWIPPRRISRRLCRPKSFCENICPAIYAWFPVNISSFVQDRRISLLRSHRPVASRLPSTSTPPNSNLQVLQSQTPEFDNRKTLRLLGHA